MFRQVGHRSEECRDLALAAPDGALHHRVHQHAAGAWHRRHQARAGSGIQRDSNLCTSSFSVENHKCLYCFFSWHRREASCGRWATHTASILLDHPSATQVSTYLQLLDKNVRWIVYTGATNYARRGWISGRDNKMILIRKVLVVTNS